MVENLIILIDSPLHLVFSAFPASFSLFGRKNRAESICLFAIQTSLWMTKDAIGCAVRFRMVTFVCRFLLDADKVEKLNLARIACRKAFKGVGRKNSRISVQTFRKACNRHLYGSAPFPFRLFVFLTTVSIAITSVLFDNYDRSNYRLGRA